VSRYVPSCDAASTIRRALDVGRDAPPAGAGFEYVEAPALYAWQPELVHAGGGRALHSSTFQLNLSRF